MEITYAKFKMGQAVSFPSTCTVGNRARKGGTITGVEKIYELLDEYKRFGTNGWCKGNLTTSKELSNGKFWGFAYRCKTIQPAGYVAEVVMVEEFKLKLTTREGVLNLYTKE
jgi:hypothetical protein